MPYANVNLEGRLVNDPEIKFSHVVFLFIFTSISFSAKMYL